MECNPSGCPGSRSRRWERQFPAPPHAMPGRGASAGTRARSTQGAVMSAQRLRSRIVPLLAIGQVAAKHLDFGAAGKLSRMAQPALRGVAPADAAALPEMPRCKRGVNGSQPGVQRLMAAKIPEGAVAVQCCSFHRRMDRGYRRDASR